MIFFSKNENIVIKHSFFYFYFSFLGEILHQQMLMPIDKKKINMDFGK